MSELQSITSVKSIISWTITKICSISLYNCVYNALQIVTQGAHLPGAEIRRPSEAPLTSLKHALKSKVNTHVSVKGQVVQVKCIFILKALLLYLFYYNILTDFDYFNCYSWSGNGVHNRYLLFLFRKIWSHLDICVTACQFIIEG